MNKFKISSNDDDDLILNLKTNGKSKSLEDYNVYEEYTRRYKCKPSLLRIDYDNLDFFDVKKIRKGIEKNFKNSRLIFKDEYHIIKVDKNISRREVWLLDDGYMMLINADSANTMFGNPKEDIGLNDYDEISSSNIVIVPPSMSKYKNDDIIDKIKKIFKNSYLKEDTKNTVGMVAIDEGGLYVKNFDFNNDFKLEHMDLHYGNDFKLFDKELINKLKNDKKGLVLLHGESGTGKTYYIRHLLSKMRNYEKNILYFPPSMVSTITEPNFINFINDWVSSSEKGCIILIEDAEPLLISRDENNISNNGITNLLNLTDGLLNDMFGIQIIATFNTELNNLDKALLRTERLIARKEFKSLDKKRALKLAEKIEVDKEKIKDNMTLSDIYSIKKKNEILLHNIVENDKKVGFKVKGL